MNVSCIKLSERSQAEKAAVYMIPLIWHSAKGTVVTIVNSSVVARGQEEEEIT